MKKGMLEILTGAILIVFSNILAFIVNYDKFYTILIFGLFFFFKGAYKIKTKSELIQHKSIVKIYSLLIAAGLILDLVLGIWLLELWHYPNYSILNYFLLYLIVYPLGFLILVYTLALFEEIFINKPIGNVNSHKASIRFSMFLFIFGILAFALALFFVENFKSFFAGMGLGFGIIGLFGFLTLQKRKNALLERFISKPIGYGLLIIFVSTFQAIINEFPNILVYEWEYINIPLSNFSILGTPLLIYYPGWIFLLVFSYVFVEWTLVLRNLREERI